MSFFFRVEFFLWRGTLSGGTLAPGEIGETFFFSRPGGAQVRGGPRAEVFPRAASDGVGPQVWRKEFS